MCSSSTMQPTQLLQTKLYRPRVPEGLIERSHLLDHLDKGMDKKLVLVTAPAGYGKTMLVHTWLNRHRTRTAWLSLDEYDNDLTLLLRYLIAAVKSAFPTSSFFLPRLLQTPQLPYLPVLATTLINELASLARRFFLVLDDYHFIEEGTIHQLLGRMIAHLPEHVHLILISRTEPPLPLARLRTQRQMTEIRAAELAFTATETGAFLAQALDRLPSDETVVTLYQQTEGWIAGLQLAGLALRERTDEADFLQSLAEGDPHVLDYLMEEVFTRQPLAVQTFLLYTAILNRLCAPLCEAVMGEELGEGVGDREWKTPAAKSILDYLEQADLFLIALDDHAGWYRYHHLLQTMLRHHLQKRYGVTEIRSLHSRASAWLADHGWIEEAIQHALAGGDEMTAAHVIAQQRHELLNREEWRTLDRWLNLLPDVLVQQRPILLIAKAYTLNFQWRLEAIPPLLQAAARLQEQIGGADDPGLQAEMDPLWSQTWYWQNQGLRSLAIRPQRRALLS